MPSPICTRVLRRTLASKSLIPRLATPAAAFFTRTFSSPSTPLPSHPRTHILHHRAFTKLQTQPRRYLSAETKTAIESAIATSPVVLFMKGTPETPQCGFSRASIQILGLQGVDPEKFSAFNVLEDDGLRAGIKEFSEWPTIPQLYVGGEFVGGCDILVAMHQSGELAKLLEERGVVVEGGAEAGG